MVSDIPAGDGKLVNLFYGVYSPRIGLSSSIIGRPIVEIYKSLTDA